MFKERTAIGLDVHARSVRAVALDTSTGELIEARLSAVVREVVAWVMMIVAGHGPVAVAYEAGPTGFGLARALISAGVPVTVAAPSKMIRPAGDRVKTDARDALLLARLLRVDELVPVRLPTMAEESARDLVRARDDARGELMAARHRVSKLLLRRGIVMPRPRHGTGPMMRGCARDDAMAWTGRARARSRHSMPPTTPSRRS